MLSGIAAAAPETQPISVQTAKNIFITILLEIFSLRYDSYHKRVSLDFNAACAFGDSRDAAAPSPTQPTQHKRLNSFIKRRSMIRHHTASDIALCNRV